MIIAKEVAPEYRTSPYNDRAYQDTDFSGMTAGTFYIYGNSEFKAKTDDFFDKIIYEYGYAECLNELDTPIVNLDITNKDIITWHFHTSRYTDFVALGTAIMKNASIKQETFITDMLTAITGDTWKHRMLYGDCQSEWNIIYYNTKYYTTDDIEEIGTEYFNTGRQFLCRDSDFPHYPGQYVYCYSWQNETMKKEIAFETCVKPEEVELHLFDGYIHTPKYEIV